MEPIITKQTGNWMTGHIGPFRFEIKRFEEPSVFGIASMSFAEPYSF